MTKSETTVTMKEFRENIGDDEEMLKFAADHLDTPDEAKVRIAINGQFVTFEVLGEYVDQEGRIGRSSGWDMACIHEVGDEQCLVAHSHRGQCLKCRKCGAWIEQ